MEKQHNTHQKESSIKLALQKILELVSITQESNPRLHKAQFIDATNVDEIAQAFDQLTQNPCLPVMLYHHRQDAQVLIKQSPLITTLYHFPNVRMINTLQVIPNLYAAYEKPKPSLFSDTDKITALEQIRSLIRHDLRHALFGSTHYDKAKLIERATKELGLTGSEDEIITMVMEQTKTIQPTSFYKVDGLFVDWDGTLYKDGSFSSELFQHASSKAEEEQLPLAIWTGGNVDEIYRTLRQLNINNIDVCSKQDCRGLNVLAAIDDKSIVTLSDYGIEVVDFQKITSFAL